MIVQVAIDLPNIETFDYSYTSVNTNNSRKKVIIGNWVIVEVKKTKKIGLISAIKKTSPAKQVKPIKIVIDALPPVDENYLAFLSWISANNLPRYWSMSPIFFNVKYSLWCDISLKGTWSFLNSTFAGSFFAHC